MSIHKSIGIATCIAGILAFCGTSAAASETKAKATKKSRADVKKMLLANPEKLFSNDFDMRGLRPNERKMLAVHRYLRYGKELEKATLERVKLTDAQRKTIKDIFREQFAYVVESNAQPRILGGRQKNHTAAPGAKNAPVPKRTQSASGASARQINRPSASPFDDPQALINRIAAELSGDQMKTYAALSDRWSTLRAQGVADGSLRQVLRATMDPKLDIDRKLREECRKLLVKKMTSLGRDRRFVKKRVKAAAEGQASVAEKLTASQRSHFEKRSRSSETSTPMKSPCSWNTAPNMTKQPPRKPHRQSQRGRRGP